MTTLRIRLSLVENAKAAARIFRKHAYDVDLRDERHVVNAKSTPGVLSLKLSSPLTVEVHADNCDDLLHELQPYKI